MNYSVVFLDIPYSHEFYLDQIKNVGGVCSTAISCTNDFKSMKTTIEFAFNNSNGMFIIHAKRLWHKLQKIMLTSFERPSLFKDEAFIIASGFKKYANGIFADIVYNKPIVFVNEEFDENFDFSTFKSLFGINYQIIGVFEGNINTQSTIFTDEVYTYIKLDNNQVLPYDIDKSKIFTYNGQSVFSALLDTIKKTSIKLAIVDLSTNAFFLSKIISQANAKDYLALYIDTCSIHTLNYIFSIDEKYVEKFGFFSETFAKDTSSFSLQISNADCAISIINSKDFHKFLFLAYYKDNSFEFSIKEFSGSLNTIYQKAASYAALFLRQFILSRNL